MSGRRFLKNSRDIFCSFPIKRGNRIAARLKNNSSDYPMAETITSALRRSCVFEQVLVDDLTEAKRFLEANNTQFARRTYCRTLMALFEGMVSDLKSHVLSFDSHVLGTDEINLLKKRLGALESAFHSFDLYTNVAGTISPLEKDSNEWRILKRAIEIRNRITHPTSQLDLEISNLELGHLRTTEQSIFDLLCRCLKDSARARLRQIRALDKRRNQYFGTPHK
jgi:hypothetical protein